MQQLTIETLDEEAGAASLQYESHAAPGAKTLLVIEFLTSCGTNFLQVGIFFYTHACLGWTLGGNFRLATGQGVCYVTSALLAKRLTRRLRPSAALALVYSLMTLASLLACWGATTKSSPLLAVALLGYSSCSALGWPILESLVSQGLDARTLSRRIATYNVVWAGAGAMVLAANGTIIQHWSLGVFLLPAAVHFTCASINGLGAWRAYLQEPFGAPATADFDDNAPAHPAIAVEAELLRVRKLALWLSRSALPATYVCIYSLMALMPSLTLMKTLSTAQQTLVGSSWMAARWLVFLLLGAHGWWHTRPRLLTAAAVLMLAGFVGVVVRPSIWFGTGHAGDVASVVLWQLVLGAAIGLIYAASLYFGMVLSDGSTEHGGYHEALIGLGSFLGPGAGAAAQRIWPGNVNAGITAVGTVIALSVLTVFAVSLLIGRRQSA